MTTKVNKARGAMSKVVSATVLGGCLLVGASAANADLLDVGFSLDQDLFSGGMDVSYTDTTNRFLATTNAMAFFDPNYNPVQAWDDGNPNTYGYTLDAIIDETGSVVSGTLNVLGGVSSLGIPNSPSDLLVGDIVDFGWQTTAGRTNFQFLVQVTDSELGLGPQALVMMNNVDTVLANVDPLSNVNFTDSGVNANNVSVVPVPASLALLALGLVSIRLTRK